jgi:hypothetical protein
MIAEKKEGAMKIISLIVLRISLVLGLLAMGFALGFPLGQQKGFDNGSEWAIVQADMAAREAGMVLPFSLEDGQIRVVVRQSPDLHKWAQKQAALYYSDRLTVAQVCRVDMPVDVVVSY